MKYRNILLATDLSGNSKKAAERARIIADNCQAQLHIVHVIEHSPIAFGGEFSIPMDIHLEQTIEQTASQALAKKGYQLNISSDHQHLLNGTVKHQVLELAEKLRIDLIVVGTHGHHGFDILLGSRANAILHGATCDVLAVRAD